MAITGQLILKESLLQEVQYTIMYYELIDDLGFTSFKSSENNSKRLGMDHKTTKHSLTPIWTPKKYWESVGAWEGFWECTSLQWIQKVCKIVNQRNLDATRRPSTR
ncbi:hypothetical protein P3L10_030461 [Capsicum annuum]